MGEFRGAAKSAVDYVEALTYGLEGGVDSGVLEHVAVLRLHGELAQVLLNLAGVFQGGVPVVPVEVADAGQEGLVAGPAVHVVFGEVGAAVEDLALVGEEGGEGPAALARDGPDSALVAAVDLGPFVPVDLNGDKAVVDDGGDFGVFVALTVHDVAPMAPYCSDVEEYGLILSGGEEEGFVAPGVPVDGLVGGAFEVGAGLLG